MTSRRNRPRVKLSALPKFPADVVAGTGILIEKSGATFTFSLDPDAVPDVLGLEIGSAVQAWNGRLDDLSESTDTGIWCLTAPGAAAARTLTQPAAGFTITNPGGAGGNPTFTLANDLAALEALSSTGFAARTGSDAWAQRTLASGTGLTWANPAGTAGDPSITFVAPLSPLIRLSLDSTAAITEADVTGAVTIYAHRAGHDYVQIYNGSAWALTQLGGSLSLALDNNSGHTGYHQSGKNYFLGIINDGGTIRLASSVAWSGNTTIGTGAGTAETELFEGRLVNKVAMTVRFGSSSGNTVNVPARQMTIIGGFRASADGQTEDSYAARYLSNMILIEKRPMKATETTDTWPYSIASYRQANGSTANRLKYFVCAAGREVFATAVGAAIGSGATLRTIAVGIGIDSTTINSATMNAPADASNAQLGVSQAIFEGFPGIGYHEVNWLEYGGGADTQTWVGDGGLSAFNTGITGTVWN